MQGAYVLVRGASLKVCRVLSHEFGVVVREGSMRFDVLEPHQTISNYILTEIARYIDFFHTSSGWFDWTEPSLTTSLQEIGVQGAISPASV